MRTCVTQVAPHAGPASATVDTMQADQGTPYERLSPDAVLAALESVGLWPDGRVLALNSYENRVYQVGLEEAAPVVAKFYRPGRWSEKAILEEHAFSWELHDAEVPVVPPMRFSGITLHHADGYAFAVFERRGGRWPELGSPAEREWMGRFLGRMHAVGRARPFHDRPRLDAQELGQRARDTVLEGDWMPGYLARKYADVTDQILGQIGEHVADWGGARMLRIHGDCHRGNVLWTDAGPHFVDLDDCRTGPAVQDLWMLLSGGLEQMQLELVDLLGGYEQFCDFDRSELALIEPLRALRMMHYSAWIARRWHDPAFPRAFPWFAEARYWEQHLDALREQLEVLDGPPLRLR